MKNFQWNIRFFFKLWKSANSYLNVLNNSKQKLSLGSACALKISIVEFSASCIILYAMHFYTYYTNWDE